MNTHHKGFASIILIIALVVLLAGGIGYWIYMQKPITSTTSATVEKINWYIEKANPAIVDNNDYRKYEQAISVDVTFSGNTTKRYRLGTAYVCTGSSVESTQDSKKIFGKVDCFMAETGATFVAYSQNGRFVVERQNESGKDGLTKPVILLEI